MGIRPKLRWQNESIGIPVSLVLPKEPPVLSLCEEKRQDVVGWYASARAHLKEVQLLLGNEQEISRIVDGESGRFPPEAIYRGQPLLLGESPDGALTFPLYTGFGRRGFPKLPLLERASDPCKSSQFSGDVVRQEGTRVWLDDAALDETEVYRGCPIRLEGDRTDLAVVLSYRDRCVQLAEPVEKKVRYTLRSKRSNCYLVGKGEIERSLVWQSASETIERWIGQIDQHLEKICKEIDLQKEDSSLKFLEGEYSILKAHAFWESLMHN